MIKKGLGLSFEELLIEKKIVDKIKLQELLKRSYQEKKPLDQLLLDIGIPEEKVVAVKAEYYGYDVVKLSDYPPPPYNVLHYIKPAYAKHYKVLPIEFKGDVLTIAIVDPRAIIALEEIIQIFKNSLKVRSIKIVMTTTKELLMAIEKFYGSQRGEIDTVLSKIEESYKPEVEVVDVEEGVATENSAPIVMLANKIIENAFIKKASDIHLEPTLEHMKVRYRIDGDLAEVMIVPKLAQNALVTRLKLMADLRIDEKRLPQDGRIDFTKYNPNIEIDLRVSTIPTPYGEDMVMRILDKKSSILSLDMLGFNEHNLQLYKDAINSPYGIILHVGPTGSGKTTALYAALKALDSQDVKIVTAEDPVEYMLGGNIIQSNINPSQGYTFAKAIRAFMRHDPDIILIGEIRDLETAKTAVEAALTGHLVFSTLHTNDALGTITRLTQMGIEPFLIADSLILVCAQRLVKRICKKCIESYTATDEEERITKGDIKKGTTVYKGKGCNYCNGSGYKGRTGIYEVLLMNKEIRALLLEGATMEKLKDTARKTGMRTLREDAVEKVLKGITTVEELVFSTRKEE